MRITSRILVMLGGMMLMLGLMASPSSATGQHKVTICHATHSNTNPFVSITVAYPSVIFSAHANHQNNEDIIPLIPGYYPGLNWTATNQRTYNNGCKVPTTTTTVKATTTTVAPTTTTTSTVLPTTTVPQTTSTTALVTTTVPQTTTTAKATTTTQPVSSTSTPTTSSAKSSPSTAVVTTTELARTGKNTGLTATLGAVLLLIGMGFLYAGRQRKQRA